MTLLHHAVLLYDNVSAICSLKKAAGLINSLDSGRFARLLSRVLQKLHLKVSINWDMRSCSVCVDLICASIELSVCKDT